MKGSYWDAYILACLWVALYAAVYTYGDFVTRFLRFLHERERFRIFPRGHFDDEDA